MLTAHNISHAVNGKTLFSQLNISLQKGDKLALVGRNGSGKSTLLSILSGKVRADTGGVAISRQDRVSLVTQNLDQAQTIEELTSSRLGKEWFEIRSLPRLCAKLSLKNIDPTHEIRTLSGGEQLRLQLVLALAQNPTLLVIDEPTNHLDVSGRKWLIGFLRTFKGGYLVVSHDRDFLNQSVDMVYELEDQNIKQYTGGYSEYLVQKKQQRANIQEKYRVQENYKKRIIRDITNTKLGALERENETKLDTSRRLAAKAAKKAKAREHRLEQQMNSSEWLKKPTHTHSLILDFILPVQKRHRVFQLIDLSVGIGNNKLLSNIYLSAYSNDHIVLLGENGSGKSLLIKTILGEIKPLHGQAKLEAKVGYLSQQNNLNPSLSPLQVLQSTGINEAAARGVLDRLGYHQNQINQPTNSLSAGETVKLRLAHMMLCDFVFLILDEPTNNLDFKSIDVVQQLLQESPVGYLLVTHDQELLKTIGITSHWQIAHKHLKVIPK